MTSTSTKKNKDIGSFILLFWFAVLFLFLRNSRSDLGGAPSSPAATDFGDNISAENIPTASSSKPFRLLGSKKISSSLKKNGSNTMPEQTADLSKSSTSWFGSDTASSDYDGGVSSYVSPTNNHYLETFVEYAEHFTEKVNETVRETKKKLRQRIGSFFGFFKRIVVRKPKEATSATA